MIDALAIAITLGCLGTALTVGVQAVGNRFRWTRIAPTLGLIELALLVQAVLDVIGLATGHRPRETSTHLAYLAVSVLVVPIVAVQTRQDDGRWSAAVVLVGTIALAVLVVRLQTTWRSASG